MNERNRARHHLQNQHHQGRRQPSTPQPICQPHNNRSTYHSHPSDNYLTSSYRHPSTTTTTTDPSSITTSSQSSSNDCAASMCYSYLIAIVSSVLVVLGIYLSLTKFNIRFLYISLAGLSIEAIGACIYCLSNIRSSQLARRKQRINSDEFIINSEGNIIENHNLDNNYNRQQQINTITHILSNRTLTSNGAAGSTNHEDNDSFNEINPSAIQNNGTQQPGPQLPNLQPNGPSIGLEIATDSPVNEASPANEDATLVIQTQNHHEDQVDFIESCRSATQDSPSVQLPKSSLSQKLSEATSGDFLSSTTNLLENQQSSSRDIDNGACAERVLNQLSNNMVSQLKNSQPSDNENNDRETADVSVSSDSNEGSNNCSDDLSRSERLNEPQPFPSPANATNHLPDSTHQQVAGLSQTHDENPDLINLEQQEQQAQGEQRRAQQHGGLVATGDSIELQVSRRRAFPQGNSQQRQANLRRTLVMGLGGEEEMIEIDEEDLDNMSILPPSYESITTNSGTSS